MSRAVGLLMACLSQDAVYDILKSLSNYDEKCIKTRHVTSRVNTVSEKLH